MTADSLACNHQNSVLIFETQNAFLALDVFSIKEILNEPRIHTIPGAHDSVIGMVTVRGEPVALIDLHHVLTGERNPLDNGRFIIVLDHASGMKAMLVDRLFDFDELKDEQIQPPTALMQQSGFIDGHFISQDQKLVAMPNIDRILSSICG